MFGLKIFLRLFLNLGKIKTFNLSHFCLFIRFNIYLYTYYTKNMFKVCRYGALLSGRSGNNEFYVPSEARDIKLVVPAPPRQQRHCWMGQPRGYGWGRGWGHIWGQKGHHKPLFELRSLCSKSPRPLQQCTNTVWVIHTYILGLCKAHRC